MMGLPLVGVFKVRRHRSAMNALNFEKVLGLFYSVVATSHCPLPSNYFESA